MLYAILGEIARTYQNKVTLSLFNSYLRDFDIPRYTTEELTQLIEDTKQDGSEAQQAYEATKTGAETISRFIGLEDKLTRYKYLNTRNEQMSIDKVELDKVVAIVKEVMLASPSHHISWRIVGKKAKELELQFSPSKNFKDLVLRELDIRQQSPVQEHSSETTRQLNKAFGSELGELQIKKRFNQNQNRTMNRLKRKLTDQVLFRNQILEAIAKPIHITDITHTIDLQDQTETQTILVISDWHIGATVNLETNQYNHQIAKQRVHKLLLKSIEHIKRVQPSSVLIVNLGDLIEGVQMRANQAYSIDMSLGEQIRYAGSVQSSFVSNLCHTFPQIKFSFTELEGNHDRFAPNKKNELPQDGISSIGRVFVKMACQDLNNLKAIRPKNEYRYIAKIYDHTLMFVHGDRDKLADKGILGKLSVYSRTPIDALIGGHLHSIQIREQGNDQFVCQSGSLIGPSDYSDSLGVTSSPSQLVIDVNKDELIPQIMLI